jgi:hypothetical protein
MSTRRASPQICRSCFRLHVRLRSQDRADRREQLAQAIAWEDPVTRLHAMQLFDHLTIGSKVFDRHEADQLHPSPPPPRTWTAEELAIRDEAVICHAFGLTGELSEPLTGDRGAGRPG